MKIILLGSAHPYRGGLANYNERLALELQKQGHEVDLYTFTVQYPSFLFPGKSQFTQDPPPPGLKIYRKLNSVNPANWISVGNEIKRNRPDLLLIKYWLPFMGPAFGTVARRAKSNHHTKVITILDNVLPHEKRPGDVAFTKYYLKSSDGFIAMSNAVLNDLKQFTQTKPAIFHPHPLYDNFGEVIDKSQAKKNLGLSEDTHYLLFFGFIRKYKGLDLLLQAFADERLREFPLKLIVAGEFYGDAKPYYDLIEELKIKDHLVMRTDFIPDSEVKNYFSAADLIVQPYRHATQSGVTQIAYQFNRPMIVTNVGGLPELVPDGKVGYVVAPEAADITQAVIKFYEENRSDFFEKNISEEKKKFSWQSMVNTIEDLYKRVTRG